MTDDVLLLPVGRVSLEELGDPDYSVTVSPDGVVTLTRPTTGEPFTCRTKALPFLMLFEMQRGDQLRDRVQELESRPLEYEG